MRPAAKKKPAKPLDDEEEDDDDTPKKKRKPVARDDDDDEDDDDTLKRKRKKKGGLPKPLLIGGAIVALLMFCGCGGFALHYFTGIGNSPKTAVEEFVAAEEKGDGALVWVSMCKESQGIMLKYCDLRKAQPDGAKYKSLQGRELFTAVFADMKTNKRSIRLSHNKGKPTVLSYSTIVEIASVEAKFPDGSSDTIMCRREEGRWRVLIASFD